LGVPPVAWWVGQLGAIGVLVFLLLAQTFYIMPRQEKDFDSRLELIRTESERHHEQTMERLQRIETTLARKEREP
jgi:hypothetical protein